MIGKNGHNISKADAESYIAGYSESARDRMMSAVLHHSQVTPWLVRLTPALAIDMTARNMQEAVKKKGLPWSAAKGFDTFCPVG